MPRGRPTGSIIRQNVVEILFYLQKGYGYQLSKLYNQLFPKVTQRSVYYHLRKGIITQEIEVHAVEQEKGDFSWGQLVEKTYYALGKNAAPRGNERIKNFLERQKENPPKENFILDVKE